MKDYHCVTQLGEHLVIKRNNDGVYLCPICGSAEFNEPPYEEDGSPSFQMCSCGFEFGFDDSHLACAEAAEGVTLNWDRWRLKTIEKNKHSKSSLQRLERNLHEIGYKLAFDLLPIKFDD